MAARYDLVPVVIAGAFLGGIVATLASGIRLPLAKRLGMREARSRALPLVAAIVLMPALLLAGLTADWLDPEVLLIVGSLAAALATATLGMSQRMGAAIALLILLSVAGAALIVGATLLMPAALAPSNAVAAINLGHVFFAFGMIAGPPLVEALVAPFGFRKTLGVIALLCLAPAATMALTSAHEWSAPARGASEASLLWIACLALLLYGTLERMIAAWAAPFLRSVGHDERGAKRLTAGFWIAFVAARLTTGFAVQQGHWRPGGDVSVLVALVLLAGFALGNLAGTASRSSAAGGLLIVGFCLGPVVPTLIGLAFARLPAERGLACGALLSAQALGGVLMFPVLEGRANRAAAQRALRWPTVAALALAAAVLVFGLLLA